MRESKFRAWHKKDEVMKLHVQEICFATKEVVFGRWELKDPCGCCMDETVDWALMEDVVLMQYTGLKDKNGKEIYEGDIIDKGNRAVVRFSCGRFQPAYDKGNAEDMEDEFYRFSDTIEVIGNIYENADILEAEYE